MVQTNTQLTCSNISFFGPTMNSISCILYVYLCLMSTSIYCMESSGKKLSLKKIQAKSDTELTRKSTVRTRKNSSPEQLIKEKHQELKERIKADLSSSAKITIDQVDDDLVKITTLNKITKKSSYLFNLDMSQMPSPKESSHPDYLASKKSFEEKYKKALQN